jgi:HlyD family secretion protein
VEKRHQVDPVLVVHLPRYLKRLYALEMIYMTKSTESLTGLILVLSITCLLATGCAPNQQASAPQAGGSIPAVEAVQARLGKLPLTEDLNGTVIAQNQVALHSEISGRIVSVEAQNGDSVRKGDALVRLDDRQYREQLQQAEASYRVTEAAREQAQARLAELEASYRRTKLLVEEGLASRLEYEALEAQVTSAKASIRLAEAQMRQAKSSIEETKTILSKTVVRAPIDGTIGQRNAEVGMQATSGMQLFTIGNLESLRVQVVLTEKIFRKVKVGQPVRLFTRSSNDVQGGILEARLSRISPFLDPVTRSTEAEIDIRNADALLKPGMSVDVELLYGESNQTTLVPTSAVYRNPTTGQEGIYLVPSFNPQTRPGQAESSEFPPLSDPVAVEFRPIEVVAEGKMEIGVKGLAPGSWVVTVGQDLLSAGRGEAAVRVSSWDRVMAMQGMRREDLLQEALGNKAE